MLKTKINERKNEQANVSHAPLLLDMATHNERQCAHTNTQKNR